MLGEERPLNPSPATMSRRSFLRGLVAGAGLAALGTATLLIPADRRVEPVESFKLTDDPIDLHIRRFESQFHPDNLSDEKLRNTYVWLLAQWFADKTFGLFDSPDNPTAAAEKLYNAIEWVTDLEDERFKEFPERAAVTETPITENGKTIIAINLNIPSLNQRYTQTPSGGTVTSLMYLRDILIHEFVHLATKIQDEQLAIELFRQKEPGLTNQKVIVKGFSINFRVEFEEDKGTLRFLEDFDEASTEFIANTHQKNAGLAIGPPTYPDSERPYIERVIGLLEAVLKIGNISFEEFAKFHAESDIDGLAKAIAGATNEVFATDEEKVNFGLSVIEAVRTSDIKWLGGYLQKIKS